MTAMEQQSKSVWLKGGVRLALVVVALIGIWLGVPKARPYVIGTFWFLLISIVIGVVIAAILHWWNEMRPVKTPEDEQIRLGLMDDEPGAKYEDSEDRK